MTVRARTSWGVPLGVLFLALLAGLDWWLLNRLITTQIPAERINFGSFLSGLLVLASLPLLAVVAYHTLSCATLRYRLDRNGVTIRRGGTQWIIPIGDIQAIQPGEQLEGKIMYRHGLRWPGHEQGEGRLPGVGRVHLAATRPLAEMLLLVTPNRVFGISPDDPQRFIQAFEERRALGPNRLIEADTRRAVWLTWPFWTDRVARTLLGSAVIINLALFGYLSLRFPGLDLQLPLHFNTLGDVDRIGARTELFALPIIGLIVLGTNLVLGLILYKWERAGSYLLWGAAAGAQILFWLATFSLVP